jgi:hypothetical protein
MTGTMQSMVEWLHENPSRIIIISPAGHFDEEGTWQSREGRATFTLVTSLPDGRKVRSSVEVLSEVLGEPLSSDMIVQNAKMAIGHLLSREVG